MPLIFSATFLIKLKIAQHKAKERLEESKLQTIVLNKGNFTWFKKNKEISIDGKLFDVKSFSENDGKYQFKGIYDEDETALNKNLNSGFNKKTNMFLAGIFHLLFSANSSAFPELTPLTNAPANDFPFIFQFIPSPIGDILTPPPQLV